MVISSLWGPRKFWMKALNWTVLCLLRCLYNQPPRKYFTRETTKVYLVLSRLRPCRADLDSKTCRENFAVMVYRFCIMRIYHYHPSKKKIERRHLRRGVFQCNIWRCYESPQPPSWLSLKRTENGIVSDFFPTNFYCCHKPNFFEFENLRLVSSE
jgi:hypothetical protein